MASKVQLKTGTKDLADGVGTATRLSTTEDLYRTITFYNGALNTNAIWLGDVNVTGAAAGERGLAIPTSTSVTLQADTADQAGLRGTSGSKVIDLQDVYIDGATNGDTLSWFGWL